MIGKAQPLAFLEQMALGRMILRVCRRLCKARCEISDLFLVSKMQLKTKASSFAANAAWLRFGSLRVGAIVGLAGEGCAS
jgi:hypothetical protein